MIPDPSVEVAAKAIYESMWVGEWSDVGGVERAQHLQCARAVLEAVLEQVGVLSNRGTFLEGERNPVPTDVPVFRLRARPVFPEEG